MPAETHPIIIIPARMASTRLPGKPLKEIGGEPMIVQVWRRAMEAGVGEVAVACDGEEIARAVQAAGGQAVLTDPDLPSGSDRVWQALQRLDPQGKHDIVVNLQGDMPTLDPGVIRKALLPLQDPAVDIATLAAVITDEQERSNPAVVKVVIGEQEASAGARTSPACSPKPEGHRGKRDSCDLQEANHGATKNKVQERESALSACEASSPCDLQEANHGATKNKAQERGQGTNIYNALYFSRATVPYGDGPLYHHIGIYAYRRQALERFVDMPPSPLEQREKLEQLRALEAGMRLGVAVVDTVPLGVDTPEQLEEARRRIGAAGA